MSVMLADWLVSQASTDASAPNFGSPGRQRDIWEHLCQVEIDREALLHRVMVYSEPKSVTGTRLAAPLKSATSMGSEAGYSGPMDGHAKMERHILPLPENQVRSMLSILIHLHALSNPTNVATGISKSHDIAQ